MMYLYWKDNYLKTFCLCPLPHMVDYVPLLNFLKNEVPDCVRFHVINYFPISSRRRPVKYYKTYEPVECFLSGKKVIDYYRDSLE